MVEVSGNVGGVVIRPMAGDEEAWAAARLMAGTEPWITLGRTVEQTYARVSDRDAETYVAVSDAGEVVGVMVLSVEVPLIKGYVAALAVAHGWRGRGLGGRMLKVGEERILRESPNVFLCVSSFNTDAQRFYERHGYVKVGELGDFVVAGCSEILMRKTTGAWADFGKT